MAMSTMPLMHEHMHQWTRRQEQPRQPGQDVRPVLRNQEKGADNDKCQERQLHARAPGTLVVSTLLRHCRFLVHASMNVWPNLACLVR
jgi:hypothetical protein